MTIKDCIDIVDNIKPNQYTIKDKVMWLSFIDEIIINEVLKTHEGYDGRYDNFEGYSEDRLTIPLIVPSPYDRLYTAYLKMKIDQENGEVARYNNSAALYNTYMTEYRKHYNKTHMPLSNTERRGVSKPSGKVTSGLSEAEYENIVRDLTYILTEYFSDTVSHDKLYDIVTEYAQNNVAMLKGKDGQNGKDGKDGKDGVDGKNGRDGKDGKDGSSGADIFIAIYNETTRAELEEAYESGKTIMCKYTHSEEGATLDFYGSLAQRSDFLDKGGLLTYTFSIPVGKTIYNATLTHDPRANDLWQITEETIPEPEFYLANYGETTMHQLNGAFAEGKVLIVAYPENGDYNKIKFFPMADRGVVSEDWVEVPATYTNDGTGITAQFDESIEATDIRIQILDTTHDTSPWAKPGYGIPESTYFPSWVGLNKVELFGVSNNELTIKGSDAWGQPLVMTKQYETSFGQVLDMYKNGFGEDYTYLYKQNLNGLLTETGANTYLGGGWWQTGGPGPVNHWPLNIDLNTGSESRLISGLKVTNFTSSEMGVPQTIKVYKKNSFSQLPEIVYSFYCVDGKSISKITCSDGVWNITSSNYATEQYVNDAIASAKEAVMALLGG